MSDRRVVITGMGIVSPLGCEIDKFWERIQEGYSGIHRITKFDPTGYACQMAGEVIELDKERFLSKKEQRRLDEYSHYAVAAADMAIADSRLETDKENPERLGAIVSTGVGGLQTLEIARDTLIKKGPSASSPFMIPRMIVNMSSGVVAIRHNLQGPNFCVVSACATSAHAISGACRIIRCDEADVMVAGGSEATICELGVDGFGCMRALSTRNDSPETACRPFDKDRDGFIMGEGAGVVVLEELEHAKKRGAVIYAEVAGYGATCDANHITQPAVDGSGAARAMRLAMSRAGLNVGDVAYINAHGTSTPLNDKIETGAIKAVFGEAAARKLMVSSSKSMTAHMLGAAGCVEAIVSVLAMRNGVVPPTINYQTPDPDCDLDYVPNTARKANIDACLSNSFGFGGQNICLALKRFE
ncbi:MAG: beta-ketoacyl-ACP synthase II [Planctomycetes bacterium]|nr:beta-ketoacyl-ACP synthase II [Planctomycetota bacterium]